MTNESHVLVRRVWIAGLAAIFFVAFASLLPQLSALVGRDGIVHVGEVLREVRAREGTLRAVWLFPTLLHVRSHPAAIQTMCLLGCVGSVALAIGLAPRLLLAALWALYLSLVVGSGVFLQYQWDTLLLEATIVTLFWAPRGVRRVRWNASPKVPLLLLRVLLFRLMFFAGAVKLAGGRWSDLSALRFHYETQPLPTTFAWVLHGLPPFVHALSTIAVLAAELLVPFTYFGGRRARRVGFGVTVGLQGFILATGSFAFFNLLAALLAVTLLDDRDVLAIVPRRHWRALVAFVRRRERPSVSLPEWVLLGAYALLVLSNTASGFVLRVSKSELPTPLAWTLSITERLRIANIYGLFENIARERYELVVEGSADGSSFRPYVPRYLPYDPQRAPAAMAPYDPHLEFQLWTAAQDECGASPWLRTFMQRLLEGSHGVTRAFAAVPFAEDTAPRFVRLSRRKARFTTWNERAGGAGYWVFGEPTPFCPTVELVNGHVQPVRSVGR